jgi:predicted nucleic acid-binding protein
MNAIDTNIWIYAHDLRDSHKQRISQNLIQTLNPMVLLWQVGCEFLAATRKLHSLGFTSEQSWESLTKMCNMAHKIVLPVPEMWHHSHSLQETYGLNIWDALLASACIHGNVSILYSEDFIHKQRIDNLEIINPFL